MVVHRLVDLVEVGALTSIWRTFSEATFSPACLGAEADAPHDGVEMTSEFAILCHYKTSILEAVRKWNWNFQHLVTPVMELVQRGERPNTCPDCSGQGRVRMRQQVGPFVQDVVRECPTCNGAGQTAAHSCSPCDGTGQTMKMTTLRFSIPAGTEEGTRLRMRSRGQPAPKGKGQQGDLFIEIEVEEHPWFERSGPDLIMSLPLGYADLVLGTTVSLEHLDGKNLTIKVPAGTNSGDTLEIRKRGLPGRRSGGRGDVIVLVKLHMPKKVDKKSKKALQELRSSLAPKDLIDRIKKDASDRRS